MTQEEFEDLVAEGFDAIPEKFRKLVDNVALFVEHEPSPEVRKREGLARNETLLGLYEGISLVRRGSYGIGGALPDRIIIYRRPIEQEARGNPDMIRKIVRDTVWHEIAHHFGLDEPEVRHRERHRKRAS